MDSTLDTPAKRRKTENGHVPAFETYNSQEDSGDDLFRDFETVATVPLQPRPAVEPAHEFSAMSPTQVITQPTQIVNRPAPRLDSTGRKPSIVQVAASSPVRPPPAAQSPSTGATGNGILANSIAPLGTAFRSPLAIAKPPQKRPIIDLSDDEVPTYQGGLSDEGSQGSRKADIKPSTFIQRAQQQASHCGSTNKRSDPLANGMSKFKEITANSFYKPLEKKGGGVGLSGSIYDTRNRDVANTTSRIAAPTRSADVMATAYGGTSRPAKQARQAAPAKAVPVEDISLDDIEDYQLRKKVSKMREVVPQCSILECRNAVTLKKGNYEDALEFVTSEKPKRTEVDLTKSDGEAKSSKALNAQMPAKQQIKAPARKIQDKWAAAQTVPRNNELPVDSSPIITPQKPKRRLVQGRKRLDSSAIEPNRVLTPHSVRHKTPESNGDSDSGIGSELQGSAKLEEKVVKFFNTCTSLDLADIAAISEDIASTIISQKPFATLDQVRQLSGDVPSSKTRRQSTKKPIGEKVVDKCLDMWTGYEAVDELVKNCEALGKPVAKAMEMWGVNVFGAATAGELELLSFDDIKYEEKCSSQPSLRDSGIGTPISGIQSADDDGLRDGRWLSQSGISVEKRGYFPQPSIMSEGVSLKDYQVVGINWLSLLYDNKLSCILADDMGLGKTCQVIAFLAHLFEKGVKGPHIVVVPGSTLENWLREFSVFCPKLSVMPYYAGHKERPNIQEQIENNRNNINVIVTTYGMAKAKDDNRFLRKLKPIVCVYDEGHILKNSRSAGYDQLMKIPADFRLLLTGTPLQNNLRELASLLGFILPSVFKDHAEDLESIFNQKAKTTDENHAALLSAQRIQRARSMMTPFVLRRKKHQVLKYLPTKTRRVEYCELTQSQYEIYSGEQVKVRKILEDRANGLKKSNDTANIMMQLRKASIHPLLFRRIYDDRVVARVARACMKEDEQKESDVNLVYEDLTVCTDFEIHQLCKGYPNSAGTYMLTNDEWMDSGKVSKLRELLTRFKANGDRVLVFSQFTMVMNILEAVMETMGMRFFRLDGSTKIDERQDMIDQFYEEEDITVFLLSTKAGGAGINLACANRVIIFDSSFNPQDDIQAENRAHRVGQTREVEVIRLVTRGTIEEQIHALGVTKLALDDRVAGESSVQEVDDSKAEKQGAKAVEEMMIKQIEGKVETS